MYLVPIYILIIVGAWYAWRRDPSYSTRNTLKALAALALMIAGVVGAIQLIFRLTQSNPALSAILIMVTVLVGVLGFSIVAIRIRSGAVAPLPPTVTIGDTHRRKIRRLAKVAGLVILVLLASAAIAPPWRLGLLVISGFTFFLFAIVLFPLYFQARMLDRGLASPAQSDGESSAASMRDS